MLDWLFPGRAERRNLDQRITEALLNAAEGKGDASLSVRESFAAQDAANKWASALSAAQITPAAAARILSPGFLNRVGNALVLNGWSYWLIDVSQAGQIDLLEVDSFDVSGNGGRSSWRFRCDVQTPSGALSRTVGDDGLIRFVWKHPPGQPWTGVSPLATRQSAKLLAALETRLAQEAAWPVGGLFPTPQDGGSTNLDAVKGAIKKGGLHLVETTAAGHGLGRSEAPRKDWIAERFGANPPDALLKLRKDARADVMEACGIPASLAIEGADGTAQREAWRRFVLGSVQPVARRIEAEVLVKLSPALTAVSLDFRGLWAHDAVGRATVARNLEKAGVPIDRALEIAGLS